MSEAIHPNQLRPGDHIREYRLVRRLGTGGFAIVFLAEYRGQSYAVKVALQPASDDDGDHLDGWMRREAVSLEHLSHPNLLPVHELGRWPQPRTGYSFYVTDHVPGTTFGDWSQTGSITPFQWVGVLCEVLRPLEAMHERGMCHRDLKSENILVREGDDWPFLIDFGAVHLPCARPLTEGLAPGTIYCQPPETVRFLVGKAVLEKGARFEARPSADIYAVGVILYEALTGHHPFDPKLPLAQLLSAILTVPPADPRRLNPEAPASLCDLTLRLLSKEPSQRPPSVRVVREELERLRQTEGKTPTWRAPLILAAEKAEPMEDSRALVSTHTGVAQMPREESAPTGATPRTRHRRRGILTWALGMGLLGLIGWGLLHRVETTAPTLPMRLEQGAHSVQSRPTHEPFSSHDLLTETPTSGCSRIQILVGLTVAQLVGCATAPTVRPDLVSYLQRCPAEARATPEKLGFHTTGPTPYLYGSYIRGGTSASSEIPIDQGGPLNLKAGPVSATVHPHNDRRTYLIEGMAVTTKMRVYIQFDRIQASDGTWLPICGTAVSTAENVYGIPTREAVVFPASPVDPAKVDHSPGSVVLNDPQFMTFIEPPEGARRAKIEVADPDAKVDLEF
ncbi:serine/threonine protein kinase [Melittangium boletus]|uniref:Protein kinase domain-containing protein n=1 Tax=Melittangium boletus DSM 14713 TaxID=1294270 RepID=A0A250IGL9_9BACT|nr:serine/threonine-protein kinase [Melittangium boletus]ATB30301.1 hypothetical protein MEBOL_003761 [Melittangium boletus DSM 14713]